MTNDRNSKVDQFQALGGSWELLRLNLSDADKPKVCNCVQLSANWVQTECKHSLLSSVNKFSSLYRSTQDHSTMHKCTVIDISTQMMEEMFAGTTLLGNVHRWNITRVELCANHVTIKKLCAVVCYGVQGCANVFNQPASWQTHRPTHIRTSWAASSQLKISHSLAN